MDAFEQHRKCNKYTDSWAKISTCATEEDGTNAMYQHSDAYLHWVN
uniref:Uncharacterized protein n=1 Tax=Rhizophora mucronata TaxID=61149 RepID=A0A2P2Q9J2_RHIMU